MDSKGTPPHFTFTALTSDKRKLSRHSIRPVCAHLQATEVTGGRLQVLGPSLHSYMFYTHSSRLLVGKGRRRHGSPERVRDSAH